MPRSNTDPLAPTSRPRHSLFASLVLTAASLAPVAAYADAPSWEWRQPLPQGNSLTAMANGFGVRVAVGRHGAIVRSMMDSQWDAISPVVANDLAGVAVCNGVFVAVGSAGTVLSSRDAGATWSLAPSATTDDLSTIVCGGAGFLALGRTALITSPDGQQWTAPNTGLVTGTNPFSDSQYAGAVAGDDGSYVVEVSRPLFGATLVSILESTDATNWTLHDLPTAPGFEGANVFFRSGSYGNGTYVLINRDVILTSPDRVSWSWNGLPEYSSNPAFALPHSSTFDPFASVFVAVADLNDPAIPHNPSPLLNQSADGVSWTVELRDDLPGLVGVDALNGTLYGRGSQGAIYSIDTNGSSSLLAGSSQAVSLAGAAKLGNTLITAGRDGAGATILTSEDGIGWTTRLPSGPATVGLQLTQLGRSNARVLALGTAIAGAPVGPSTPVAAFSSTDGTTWVASDLAAVGSISDFLGIASGGGRVVATFLDQMSTGSSVLVSEDDGQTWARVLTDSPVTLGHVAYANSLFYAVSATAQDANVYVSADGEHWSAQPAAAAMGQIVLDIASVAGNAVALLQTGSGGCSSCPPPTQTMSTSSGNGVWQAQPAVVDGAIALHSSETTVFATTADGRVYLSQDGRVWTAYTSPAAAIFTGLVPFATNRAIYTTFDGAILEGPTSIGNADLVFSNGFDP